MKRESHHTRVAHKPLFSSGSARFAPSSLALLLLPARVKLVDGLYLVARALLSLWRRPGVSSGGSCDVFWERASLALPAPHLSALRAAELTDPGDAQRVPRVVCEGALLHTGGEAGRRRRSFFMDYLYCITSGVDGSFVYPGVCSASWLLGLLV